MRLDAVATTGMPVMRNALSHLDYNLAHELDIRAMQSNPPISLHIRQIATSRKSFFRLPPLIDTSQQPILQICLRAWAAPRCSAARAAHGVAIAQDSLDEEEDEQDEQAQ
ncbi:uncharacterized protein RHO25_013167 [Cercospora beticola]|nr:hypothetical protein RHO25_013167 [Cercospora beticola]CAK1356636.1 unnamed protein product [Cercospora beticola]